MRSGSKVACSSMANQEFLDRCGGSIRTHLIPGCAMDDVTE